MQRAVDTGFDLYLVSVASLEPFATGLCHEGEQVGRETVVEGSAFGSAKLDGKGGNGSGKITTVNVSLSGFRKNLKAASKEKEAVPEPLLSPNSTAASETDA